ncbi:MAG: tetratricopeptide repeat protein [Myxococcota bacterium]
MTRRTGGSRAPRWLVGVLLAALLPLALGCVTVAEFRKLERQVRDMQRGGAGGGATHGTRVADLAAQVNEIESDVQKLEGRLEVAEHRADSALEEAKAARAEASRAPSTAMGGAAPADGSAIASTRAGAPPANTAEIEAYRAAYDAWRRGDPEICVDRFRIFLQTYPASVHADDAAYWMADCYFKRGDYKTAVLRFDDVVSRYPEGNRAADALYRQGEALLRLGPGYGKAAGKAFERVLKEYPGSVRAEAAKRQLDLLGSG